MHKIKYLLLIILIKSSLLSSVVFSQNKSCNEIDSLFFLLPSQEGFEGLVEKLIAVEDYNNAVYLLNQKLLYYPDHEIELTLELIEEYEGLSNETIPCNCTVLVHPEWVSSNGPEGADATSFYLDNSGGYWLGTGSSGGVYYSSNKGKSWEERNNGIGPWHISNMLFDNDTLFIKVNASYNGKNGKVRFYYWESKSGKWKHIANDSMPELFEKFDEKEDKISRLWDSTSTRLNYSVPSYSKYSFRNTDYFMKRGINPIGFINESYEGDPKRVFGFYEHNAGLAKLNKGFPRDMVSLPAGNLFDIGKGNEVLLSKSGLYLIKKKKQIKPLSIKGLTATDVRQMVTNAEGDIFGLVNEADIWKYKDGKWTCVFNAYEHHIQMTNPISKKGYDTQQLSIQKDGSILFSFCGDLWKLPQQGSAYKMEIREKNILSIYPNAKIVYHSASFDNNNDLYIIASIYYTENLSDIILNQEEMDFEVSLLKYSDNNLSLVKSYDSYSEPWIFSDASGKVWLKEDDLIKGVGIDAVTNDNLKLYYNYELIASIAQKDNGDFAFINNGTVWLWSASQQIWKEIASLKNLRYLSCIGFDSKGNLFAGSGKQYSIGCGSGFDGEANGLFQWKKDHWEAIINTPNTWVFSLTPEKEYGLAVGTSGSGVQLLKTK